ncbi:MAG: glycosyltransferase [Chitinophagaceae bacterium]|nr:glycosyltransferase [Chitinophagaceae bacterium]
MKPPDPKITVLMPAFNAEKYIGEAIGSVLNQSFTDFELLIINDGSTDATEKIIRSFSDERIRLINQANQGVSAALNIGLLNANAELIARVDADDICLPCRLEKQFNFLRTHPDYVLVGSDAAYVDRNGDFVFLLAYPAYSDAEIKNLPIAICPFSHVTVMYRKQAALEAGMYDVNAHSFEDHLLWHKLMKKGKVSNLKETLMKVRFSPGSLTIDDEWRGKEFKKLKQAAIRNTAVSPEDGEKILGIIRRQNSEKTKTGAYYSLLAKKYLFNNHNIPRARQNIRKLIQTYPVKLQGYLLYGLSLLPESLLKTLYKMKQNNSVYAKAT